jgi:hypothetical protein
MRASGIIVSLLALGLSVSSVCSGKATALFPNWDGKITILSQKMVDGTGVPFGHSAFYQRVRIHGVSTDPLYGQHPDHPIQVGKTPETEQDYLLSLLDAKGEAIYFECLGQAFPHPNAHVSSDTALLDVVLVTSPSGRDTLFFDPYTKGSLKAPMGYTLPDSKRTDIMEILRSGDRNELRKWDYDLYQMSQRTISRGFQTEADDDTEQLLFYVWVLQYPGMDIIAKQEIMPRYEDVSNDTVRSVFLAAYYEMLYRSAPGMDRYRLASQANKVVQRSYTTFKTNWKPSKP